MSSVSTLGNNSSLLAWLQQLSGQTPGQATDAGTATGRAAQDSDGDHGASGSQGVKPAAGQHRHGHRLSSQLQSAIASALQSAGASSDPNQVIQTAIETFLNSTSNTAASTTATAPDNTAAASASADGSSGATTAAAALTDPTGQQTALAQLLQSYGVDPSQFHQDLFSAIQNAQSQGGNVDFSQIFQSFPPGSELDVTG